MKSTSFQKKIFLEAFPVYKNHTVVRGKKESARPSNLAGELV